MARLSFEREFSKNDILWIKNLGSSGQAVFLLEGEADSSIVVKGEVTEESFKVSHVNQIMNIVSPNARSKVLSRTELNALEGALRDFTTMDGGDDQDYTNAIKAMTNVIKGGQRVLIKMETLKLTTLEKANDRNSKKIGKALNAPNGLEDLGKIISADMFVGNNDRFDFSQMFDNDTKDRPRFSWGDGIHKKPLWYLYNVGNIMVHESLTHFQVIGLDAFDYNNRTTGWQRFADDDERERWPYRIFHPDLRKGWVALLSERVAEDMKTVVGKTTGTISRYRLARNAAQRIAIGMNLGADLIEKAFKAKYGHPGAITPPGLIERIELAGWTWWQGTASNVGFGNLTRSRTRN